MCIGIRVPMDVGSSIQIEPQPSFQVEAKPATIRIVGPCGEVRILKVNEAVDLLVKLHAALKESGNINPYMYNGH